MRHLVELSFGGGVEARVVVAVDGAPPRRHAVDQLPAVLQFDADAFGSSHRIGGQGSGGRGIGVPQVVFVPFQQGRPFRGGMCLCHDGLVFEFGVFPSGRLDKNTEYLRKVFQSGYGYGGRETGRARRDDVGRLAGAAAPVVVSGESN